MIDEDQNWRQLRRNIVNAVVLGSVMSIATVIYSFIEMKHRLESLERGHESLEMATNAVEEKLALVDSKATAVTAIVADRAASFIEINERLALLEGRISRSSSEKMGGRKYRNSMYADE